MIIRAIITILLGLTTLTPTVFAEAEGPDYFQNHDQVTNLHQGPDATSTIVHSVPANQNALRNKGCLGAPSYEQWSNMEERERENVADDIWCKTSYNGQTGWVQKKYLSEGTAPSSPTFDCSQATHEIEKIICDSPKLIRLDHIMQEVYKDAIKVASSMDVGADESVKNIKNLQYGWVKGRNECWKKLEDRKSCAFESYQERIARLQAEWMLVEKNDESRFICNENPANEVYVAYYTTDTTPAISVEYGDNREVFVKTPTANGDRYDGYFGKYLWVTGKESVFVWDQFKPEQNCKLLL